MTRLISTKDQKILVQSSKYSKFSKYFKQVETVTFLDVKIRLVYFIGARNKYFSVFAKINSANLSFGILLNHIPIKKCVCTETLKWS